MKDKKIEIINYKIREETKDFLTNSPIHKTPLYPNEAYWYFKNKQINHQKFIQKKIDEFKLTVNDFVPKSRNLIKKFK